jgi:alanine racemase
MKLSISIHEFAEAIQVDSRFYANETGLIQRVSYDTRNLLTADETVFFALDGPSRSGTIFIEQAIQKGVKYVVFSGEFATTPFPNVVFFKVENSLRALQHLAHYHRSKFSYPVFAITGSVGKTTVKEWLFHLLKDFCSVVRSPKSFNSQLGVALSLLEMSADHELALVEAGISEVGEMDVLEHMIEPTHGIFTAFGTSHREGFQSEQEHLAEKVKLFQHTQEVWLGKRIPETGLKNCRYSATADSRLALSPFQDEVSISNLALCLSVFDFLLPEHATSEKLKQLLTQLPRLALRMETIEGIQGNTIINDAYNLDIDALRHALEFQASISKGKKRILLLAMDGIAPAKQASILEELKAYALDEIHVVKQDTAFEVKQFSNSVILIKGSRISQLERLVSVFRAKKHKTRVEIDFSAVRHNLNFIRKKLPSETKILAMIKASSYGSGAEKMAEFLEKNKVEYLGVAYADEGVELRKQGIHLPILVMNSEEEGFDDIIDYNLEPTLYSFRVLDEFIKRLIYKGKMHFPVQLKINTGMNRLGFSPNEVAKALEICTAQPELHVKGVYSHLADADNLASREFTNKQLALFEQVKTEIDRYFAHSEILYHLCNTEGAMHYPHAHFDMVRIGIGLYGESSDEQLKKFLKPAIAWKSVISQIQTVKAGESVGYGASFQAERDMQIAVIPVGYADGFKRILSNGRGSVIIQQHACKVVGRVCMDMSMVDVTDVVCKEGDEVEIIGSKQTLGMLAASMQTIPYEVLTSMSKRLVRIYLDE